jgi:hypothetical protein
MTKCYAAAGPSLIPGRRGRAAAGCCWAPGAAIPAGRHVHSISNCQPHPHTDSLQPRRSAAPAWPSTCAGWCRLVATILDCFNPGWHTASSTGVLGQHEAAIQADRGSRAVQHSAAGRRLTWQGCGCVRRCALAQVQGSAQGCGCANLCALAQVQGSAQGCVRRWRASWLASGSGCGSCHGCGCGACPLTLTWSGSALRHTMQAEVRRLQ